MLAIVKVLGNTRDSHLTYLINADNKDGTLKIAKDLTYMNDKQTSSVEYYTRWLKNKVFIKNENFYSLLDIDYYRATKLAEVILYPTFFKAIRGYYGNLSTRDKFNIFKERFKSFFFYRKK